MFSYFPSSYVKGRACSCAVCFFSPPTFLELLGSASRRSSSFSTAEESSVACARCASCAWCPAVESYGHRSVNNLSWTPLGLWEVGLYSAVLGGVFLGQGTKAFPWLDTGSFSSAEAVPFCIPTVMCERDCFLTASPTGCVAKLLDFCQSSKVRNRILVCF